MDKIEKMRKAVLKDLCERLNKRAVAARLTEKDSILTLLWPFQVKGDDVFCDIFFLQTDERAGDASVLTIRAEIADVSGLSGDDLMSLCMKVSVLNDNLPLGAYGVSVSDEEGHPDKLVFATSIPLIGEIRDERLLEVMESTLSMTAQIIQNSIGDFL